MPGIKRRVEAGGEDRADGGKKAKKDAAASSASTKKKYIPPAMAKKGWTVPASKLNKQKKAEKLRRKEEQQQLKRKKNGARDGRVEEYKKKKQLKNDIEEEPEIEEEEDDDMEASEGSDLEMESDVNDESGDGDVHTDADSSTNEDEEIVEEEQEQEILKNSSQNGSNENEKAPGSSSREAHAKQKVVLQERKAAKPNADLIARSKKLWERLRRKSHVPREERKKLISELFDIITGRVSDFVFKHDSVRVIQTALKYATLEQRKQIARELKGNYKALAESKYAKFLIGKLLVHGDAEIRDMIIPEFYGNVKRLIRHPEASWILDDIYRTVATKEQKANLLREWYGPEFQIFREESSGSTSDLSQILAQHPEKKSPIMQNLWEMVNQLVQKKTTGFTILHDAMLQYFLNTTPGSTEAAEFIELIKGDEEGDLAKNMAFTKSGSRAICLTLAHSSAKDRKLLLRFYRDVVKIMAADLYGHTIILTTYEVVDDTKLSAKSIFPELLNQGMEESARHDELLHQVNDLTARIPIVYLFAADRTKWLLPDGDQELLEEIRKVRAGTSKKEPSIRRQELIKAASPSLLEFIAARAKSLMATSFGCQLISEVLFDAEGDKSGALAAVARASTSKPELKDSIFVGRMLKSLVQGGRFNNKDKTVVKVEPPLQFESLLYGSIKDDVMTWAASSQPFVVVALIESKTFDKREELLKILKKNIKTLEKAAAANNSSKKDGKTGPGPAAGGIKLLLEQVKQ